MTDIIIIIVETKICFPRNEGKSGQTPHISVCLKGTTFQIIVYDSIISTECHSEMKFIVVETHFACYLLMLLILITQLCNYGQFHDVTLSMFLIKYCQSYNKNYHSNVKLSTFLIVVYGSTIVATCYSEM
jgi:hypothetical protein